MSRHIFWVVITGFFIGVLWRSFFDWGSAAIAFVFFCAICVLLYALLSGVLTERKLFLIVTVALCAVGGGMIRFAINDVRHRADPELAAHVERMVVLEGVVRDEPEERDTYTQLTIEVRTMGHERVPVSDRVLVYAPHYPQLRYGDQVEISGTLKRPEVIQEKDGRIFLYPEYLKKDGIHFLIKYPKIIIHAHDESWSLRGALFSLKQRFLDALKATLPEPQVSLLGGLVVGAKEALGKDLLDTFRVAGVVHMVVLSGYNVSIIARYVMSALAWLPRTVGWGVGSIAIILFALLTGGSATVVRASIMALLVLVAQASGRKFDALRALFAAAFVMVLHNPRILAFDPSFQLSFLATLGLVVCAPRFEEWFSFLPTKLGLREVVAATFATELFVLPFLLWMTGTFSVVAPLTNVLVLWLVPVTMGVGVLLGGIAMLSVALAYPLSIIAYLLLSYQLWIITHIASLPFAAMQLPAIPLWVVTIVYGALMLGAYRIASKRLPS